MTKPPGKVSFRLAHDFRLTSPHGFLAGSPPNHDQQGFQPPFRSEYEQKETHWGAFKGWWDRNILGRRPPVVPSGYLTLIPLSGGLSLSC